MRRRPGGVGLRSDRPSITRAMGPSISWDPWPRPVARADMGGGRRSVHRLAKMASRHSFGSFVYTVAPLWTDVRTQECTQTSENGLSAPFWGTCVHCCAVRVARVAMRVASGGTSAPTAMACRRHPLGGHLSPGRENRARRTDPKEHVCKKSDHPSDT